MVLGKKQHSKAKKAIFSRPLSRKAEQGRTVHSALTWCRNWLGNCALRCPHLCCPHLVLPRALSGSLCHRSTLDGSSADLLQISSFMHLSMHLWAALVAVTLTSYACPCRMTARSLATVPTATHPTHVGHGAQFQPMF